MKNVNTITEQITANREQWFKYRRTMEANLSTLETIYAAQYDAESPLYHSTPAQTVAAFVESVGHAAAVEIVASLVNRSAWDGRISRTVSEWASIQENAWDEEAGSRLSIYTNRIHMAHLDQIATAMMKYEPAAEPQEEPAEIDVSTLADDLDLGDHADRLNDYRDSSTYICDAISEIADSDTSIYNSDILNFIRENPESLADVVAEGLYEVFPGVEYDLYKHGQAAEYMTIEQDIYAHLRDAVMLCAVDFIRYDLHRETIPAELTELLEEWADAADNNDRMDDIPDKIREYFTEAEESEEN